MDDFTTDEDTNDNDDEDSGGDRKSKRRTMKNIKLRKKQTRTTPTKTKADKLTARRPADRIPPPAFIKALASGKKPGNHGGSAMPAPKQTRAGRSGKRKLPPFPILESGGISLDTKTTFDVPFGLGLVRRKELPIS
ncbi:hypothetical protein WAI453_013102 [Rhynchosporium graminicola]